MKNLLLLLLTVLPFFMRAQVVYEDFEAGASLNWTALNGVYNGVFANPDPSGINPSDSVGSYTKSDEHSYSLFLAELATPMDLSVNNQFKIQINAPVATQVLMKLEGPSGAIESIKNIPLANVWREYTFDFSAAAGMDSLTKIILFFDPGVQASGDTYLFDNLSADPAGLCAGTTLIPDLLDDFECQRNASYGVGWDSLSVVGNPDPSGINISPGVGEYIDPLDEWSALVLDFNSPLDLSSKNTISAKIWSPKTGQILFKLEGGVSPAAERFIPITVTNQWVEYKADFSDQAAASHKKIAIFFNAGAQAVAGDVYYIDDIQREETPQQIVLEDFEPQKMTWEPLNNNAALHGTFNGAIANPDATGDNTSATVGSYTKGSSAFSTLTALLPTGFSLDPFTQINLQVWAPAGATTVTAQLVSPVQGIKEVTQNITTTGAWQTLTFDFVDHATITDFEQINLLFDPSGTVAGPFYYDNLTLGASTVDPCEGVLPMANHLDDFECQRNVAYGAGADRLEVVNNPDVSLGNASTKVGEYTDALDEWSALVLDFGAPVDLSVFNQFQIKIWSPVAAPLLFKLEGGTSPAVEIDTTVANTGSWQTYLIDFSAQAGENHQRLAIFFNAGTLPAQEDIYYIDDLQWKRSGINGCAINYEAPLTTVDNFTYFANGHLEAEGYTFKVVPNPNPSGINTSATVGEFVKASDGASFAGMFGDLDAPVDFKGVKTVTAKVHMDHIGNFAIKLEGSQAIPPAPALEIPVANTVINAWEELTFDFSAAADDARYTRITLFFDLLIDATGVDVTSYFDDIVFGAGSCALTRISDLMPVRKLTVYPNPASDAVQLDNIEDVVRLEIISPMGQRIRTVHYQRQTEASLDISDLKPGIYILAAYGENGLIANTKIVKN